MWALSLPKGDLCAGSALRPGAVRLHRTGAAGVFSVGLQPHRKNPGVLLIWRKKVLSHYHWTKIVWQYYQVTLLSSHEHAKQLLITMVFIFSGKRAIHKSVPSISFTHFNLNSADMWPNTVLYLCYITQFIIVGSGTFQRRLWLTVKGPGPSQLSGHHGGLLQRAVAQLVRSWRSDGECSSGNMPSSVKQCIVGFF